MYGNGILDCKDFADTRSGVVRAVDEVLQWSYQKWARVGFRRAMNTEFTLIQWKYFYLSVVEVF